MRTAFIETLHEIAAQDARVVLVVGDLGFSVVEEFARRFPKQFLNVGVAEQNMTGIAAGLALSGHVVFTYSIANFPTLRCLEQIRNDVCYHGGNVNIVAVGGGYVYGALGASHHATEDLAIMRSLPEMTVVAPGDPLEAAQATRHVAGRPGPSYLRLGKAGEPIVHGEAVDFHLGRAVRVRRGGDLTVIATGGILWNVVTAADRLREQYGIEASVLSMHTVKPLDEDAVRQAATQTPLIVTVEEHSIMGGLGGAVSEVLAEMEGPRARLERVGLPSRFVREVGDQQYLRERHQLGVDGILDRVRQLVPVRI